MKYKVRKISKKFLVTIMLVIVLFPCLYIKPVSAANINLRDSFAKYRKNNEVRKQVENRDEPPKEQHYNNSPAEEAKNEEKKEEEKWTDVYSSQIVRVEGTVAEVFDDASGNRLNDDTSREIIPISGVNVDGIITDSTGSYQIDGPTTADLRFVYGDIDNANNDASILNILSHNGVDYFGLKSNPATLSTGKSSTTKREVIESHRGAVQIFLLIDGSPSMQVKDENGMSKFDYSIESSKNLIDFLLKSGDNVYIGIVGFAGKPYLVSSITQNENHLFEKLDLLQAYGEDERYWAGSTNLYAAVEKAMDNFYIDETDPDYLDKCIRDIVIVSDGIPTAYGPWNNPTYCLRWYYSDEQLMEEFENAINATLDYLYDKATEENINFMSLISQFESDDTSLYEIIEILYSSVGEFQVSENIDEFKSQLENTILPWVQEIKKENPNRDYYNFQTYTLYGDEDPDRKKEVEDSFSGIFSYNSNKNNLSANPNATMASNSVLFSSIDRLRSLQNYSQQTFTSIDDIRSYSRSLTDTQREELKELANLETNEDFEELITHIETLSKKSYMVVDNDDIVLGDPEYNPYASITDSESDTIVEIDSTTRHRIHTVITTFSGSGGGNVVSSFGYTDVKTYYESKYQFIRWEFIGYEQIPSTDENGNQTYINGNPIYEPVYDWVENSTPVNIERTRYTHENISTAVDLTLQRKEHFTVYTRVKATALQIVLNDNSILSTIVRDIDTEDDITNTRPLLEVLDDDVAHGATIKIEYTIQVKNSSPCICKHLDLIDYLPNGFYYSYDTPLITERGTNSDSNWVNSTLNSVYDAGLISKSTYENYGNRNVAILTLDNDGKGQDGFFTVAGNTYETKIVVSRVISSADDIPEKIENDAEVLGYIAGINSPDSEGVEHLEPRRMTVLTSYVEDTDATLAKNLISFLGVYPGDSKNDYTLADASGLTRGIETTGIDFAQSSNPVFLVPPTGTNKYHHEKMIILSSITLLSTIGIFLILKKHKKI